MGIHPQVIEKEGKKEFVILPYEEFLAIKENPVGTINSGAAPLLDTP